MNFFTTGISYKNAPIDVREHLTLKNDAALTILSKLKKNSLIRESLYLNTCNRVEIYAVAGNKLRDVGEVHRAFYAPTNLWYTKTGKEAISHLFRVASSLDAMVVGETQIMGQVKSAYLSAREKGIAGPLVGHMVSHALEVARLVRLKTKIGEGEVSIASIASNLALKRLSDVLKPTALVVGTGEMGALVAKYLKKRGDCHLLIANRTFEKAVAIAEHAGGEALLWKDLWLGIARANVVVSATGAPVISVSMVKKALKYISFPLLLIDLGTPRDIEPNVRDLNGVELFNIDHLEEIALKNSKNRLREAKKAENIVADEVLRFMQGIKNPLSS